MRRALRWFFAVTGTLVFAVAVLLWIRSYQIARTVILNHYDPATLTQTAWIVETDTGELRGFLIHVIHRQPPADKSTDWRLSYSEGSPSSAWFYAPEFELAGFSFGGGKWTTVDKGTFQFSGPTVPLWFVALISATIAFYAGWRIRRARYVARNPTLCKSCGYDLRAGHDKCPECGGESHVAPAFAAK